MNAFETNNRLPVIVLMGALLMIFSGFSCNDKKDSKAHLEFNPRYSMQNLPVSEAFEGPTNTGPVTDTQIDEASGLVRSVAFDRHFWVHNDSGDQARLFLLNENGSRLATYQVSGATNRDWEDIAIGPGPESGVNYLYIAETGDNRAIYPSVGIYRVPEPRSIGNSTENAAWIEFQYPNGARDAETLLSDPYTGDLYIITKREFPTAVFRLKYPQVTGALTIASHVGNLPFTGALGGDISADGRYITIKTETRVFMWSRTPQESIAEAFSREPVRLAYVPELQGEAIGWSNDGRHYYTISERVTDPVSLYRYSAVAQSVRSR